MLYYSEFFPLLTALLCSLARTSCPETVRTLETFLHCQLMQQIGLCAGYQAVLSCFWRLLHMKMCRAQNVDSDVCAVPCFILHPYFCHSSLSAAALACAFCTVMRNVMLFLEPWQSHVSKPGTCVSLLCCWPSSCAVPQHNVWCASTKVCWMILPSE